MAISADDYLDSLRGEAIADSSGSFSLDLEKARATLQRFQLPSPDHFVLPLVICAVAGGADSLSYYHHQQSVVVDLGGLAVRFEDRSKARAYLELALLTALRRAGTKVVGASWDGSAGFEFQDAQRQLQIRSLELPPWEQDQVRTRLILTPADPVGRWLVGAARWLAGLGQESEPAAQLLKSYSRYSPVPIRLQGRQINLERQGHWKLLTILNQPPLNLRPLTSLRQLSVQQELPFAGYLGSGVDGGGVLVIVDGLLYPMTLPGMPEDFRAILWHSGLPRDLSLLNLSEGEELESFRRQILGLWKEMKTT